MPPAVVTRPCPTIAATPPVAVAIAERPSGFARVRRPLRVLWRDAELSGRQLDLPEGEERHEGRAVPGRLQLAEDLAVAEVGLPEREDLLGKDLVVLDAEDLDDADDLPRAVAEPGRVDDDVDRGRDLLPDRPHRQLVAGHEDHRLDAPEHVGGRVRMTGGHRPLVAGRHRLDHVQRLAGTTLADDDAVGAHVEGVAQEIADRDLAACLEVGRSRLEGDDVLLLELELGRVLDRDDAFLFGDELRRAR